MSRSIEEKGEEYYKSKFDDLGIRHYGKTESIAMYLIGSIRKFFADFKWGSSSFALEVLANVDVKLPVTSNNDIDFNYMGKYIKVIQKLLIKDVVKYKGKVMLKTKL